MSTIKDSRLYSGSNVGIAPRVGRYQDRSTLKSAATALGAVRVAEGVAVTSLDCHFDINAPATADVDYYVAAVATGTTAKTFTLLNGGISPDKLEAVDGQTTVIPRGYALTVDGATDWVGVLTVSNSVGYVQTIAISNSFGAAGTLYIPVTGTQVISLVQTTSSNDVSLTFGTSNTFGLPYPYYTDYGLARVAYNAAGTAFPSTASGTATAVINPIDITKIDGFSPLGTAATTAIGIVTGAIGTAFPVLQTADLKNTTTAAVARFRYTLPPNYVSGGAITIVANAQMITTVASNSAATTVDFRAFKNGAGSDIVATAAQSADLLTAANYSFTVTPTGLVAGDTLDIEPKYTITDVATGTAVIGQFTSIKITYAALASTVSSGNNWAFTVGVPDGTLTETVDIVGTVTLGASNAPGATGAPDGTADYSILYPISDLLGVPGSYVSPTGTAKPCFTVRP